MLEVLKHFAPKTNNSFFSFFKIAIKSSSKSGSQPGAENETLNLEMARAKVAPNMPNFRVTDLKRICIM